jgi:hypothetical protein
MLIITHLAYINGLITHTFTDLVFFNWTKLLQTKRRYIWYYNGINLTLSIFLLD